MALSPSLNSVCQKVHQGEGALTAAITGSSSDHRLLVPTNITHVSAFENILSGQRGRMVRKRTRTLTHGTSCHRCSATNSPNTAEDEHKMEQEGHQM